MYVHELEAWGETGEAGLNTANICSREVETESIVRHSSSASKPAEHAENGTAAATAEAEIEVQNLQKQRMM